MSSEVEPEKNEETTTGSKEQQQEAPAKKTLKQKVQENWQIAAKLLELLICCLCLGLAFDAVRTIGIGNSDLNHIGIMYTAYTGFMLINAVFIVSKYFGDCIPYRTSAMFSVSGAALFLITGVLLLVDRSSQIRRYSYNPQMPQFTLIIISAVFAFINSAIFVVDAVYTFRRQQDF